ncbi:hypothetical protein THERMOS_778 [Bathymodiolus thermophilus thioautotrophic gill symbiont]|uniref:Uncharacterized protein n=1 Tax=Bathymodiolus thermophilus thioautotrophic gill symbiont TaxID=2360 RepID=A0A8H8XC57_9GAMM|nr:hypothetical protein THERMOS_778 [Bathymodiolus thermophilus thioautotrophic gill symbiont]
MPLEQKFNFFNHPYLYKVLIMPLSIENDTKRHQTYSLFFR